MPGYVYRGTQRGENDPWAPKPKPQPKPDNTQQLEPCGTYPAYRRHIRADEQPDLPCIEAMRAYNRQWRAKHKRTPEQKARKRERDRANYQRKKAA